MSNIKKQVPKCLPRLRICIYIDDAVGYFSEGHLSRGLYAELRPTFNGKKNERVLLAMKS